MIALSMMNTYNESLPSQQPNYSDRPLRHALLHVLAMIGAGIGGVSLAE